MPLSVAVTEVGASGTEIAEPPSGESFQTNPSMVPLLASWPAGAVKVLSNTSWGAPNVPVK